MLSQARQNTRLGDLIISKMTKKTNARWQQRRPAEEGDATPSTGKRAAGAEREGTEDGDAAGKGAVFLPPHLVDGILWYLGALESTRLAAVCRSWAAIVSRRLSDPAPHLFAFRSKATHRRGAIMDVPLGGGASCFRGRAAVTPAHRTLQRVTRKTECIGATANGRLVLVNSRRTVLFNPVSGTFRRIKKFPGESHLHPMPVVPIACDSFFHAGWNEVGIWRAEDDKWTLQRVGYAESLRMAVLCGDSFYVLDTDGHVFQIALPTLHATRLTVPSLYDKSHTALAGAIEKGNLVEADGEVLFVWPLFTTRRVAKRDIDPELLDSDDDNNDDEEDDDYFYEDVTALSGFDIYGLDMTEMQWVKREGLAGDVALFVSRWSSFPVRASEKGCVSNCVYFVCDEGAGDTWGAFSLGERRMLFEHAIGTGSYKERLWFYPMAREPRPEDLDRRLEEIEEYITTYGC